jgi:hypothetical protein
MAGLLDFLQTPAGQGLLSAGLGVAANAGRGGTWNAIGRGGLLGLQGYAGAENAQLQREGMRSEIDQRKAAIAKQAEIQGYMRKLFGEGGDVSAPQVSPGAFAPAADGYGPTMPPSMANQAQPGSRLANLSIDQVAGLHARGGPNLLEAYKWVKDPLKLEAGSTYQDRATGNERFIPKVDAGIAPGANGFYSPLPGYADAQANIEGAKAGAVERARAGQDLVQVAQPDGSTRYVPRASVVSASQPQPQQIPPSGSPRVMPDEQRGRDAESIRMIQAELNNPNIPPDQRAGLTRELQRLTGAQSQPGFPTPSLGGGVQATASTSQKLSAEAGGKLNDSWIRTRYEPTIAAGDTARDLADTVNVTRQAMGNLGGTGWTTQTKAAGAAILTGLGIAPKSAEMFAANAEVFQAKVTERINAELNSAKGPQTDQDAVRATKTYASLKNTTRANEFVLDYAEAKARLDEVKAKFYQQAMPLARDKGDLSEVDREWAKLRPSIFTMPTMKRWGGGVK